MLEDNKILELIKEINILIKGIISITILLILCILILISELAF